MDKNLIALWESKLGELSRESIAAAERRHQLLTGRLRWVVANADGRTPAGMRPDSRRG